MNPRTFQQRYVDFIKNNLGELVMAMEVYKKKPQAGMLFSVNGNKTPLCQLFESNLEGWQEALTLNWVQSEGQEADQTANQNSFIYGDEGVVDRFLHNKILSDKGLVKILDDLAKEAEELSKNKKKPGWMLALETMSTGNERNVANNMRKMVLCRREVIAYRNHLYDDLRTFHPEFFDIVIKHKYPYAISNPKKSFRTQEDYLLSLMALEDQQLISDSQTMGLDRDYINDISIAQTLISQKNGAEISLTRKKIQCLDEMLLKLDLSVDVKNDTASSIALGFFQDCFKKSIPTLSARRDSRLTTFLKVIASVLAVGTVVGTLGVRRIWETEGSKMVKKVKPILKPSPNKKHR